MSKKYQDTRSVFSLNLRRLRKSMGLNQENAAQMIGVKQNTWSNYENGKSRPDIDILEKIIKLLDTDRDTLFDDPNDIPFADPDLNQTYAGTLPKSNNIIAYIDDLEQNGELRVDISNNLKSYILMLYQELNEHKANLIKQYEKYDSLRDSKESKH